MKRKQLTLIDEGPFIHVSSEEQAERVADWFTPAKPNEDIPELETVENCPHFVSKNNATRIKCRKHIGYREHSTVLKRNKFLEENCYRADGGECNMSWAEKHKLKTRKNESIYPISEEEK